MLRVLREDNENTIRIDEFMDKVSDVYYRTFPDGLCNTDDYFGLDKGVGVTANLYFGERCYHNDLFNILVVFILKSVSDTIDTSSLTKSDYYVYADDCEMLIRDNRERQDFIRGATTDEEIKHFPIDTVVSHKTEGDMEDVLDMFDEYVTDIRRQVEEMYSNNQLLQSDINEFDIPKKLGLE